MPVAGTGLGGGTTRIESPEVARDLTVFREMYGYVCMYLCMLVCLYVCVLGYIYVWICMAMYGYVWLCMAMYGYVCMFVCMYVWLKAKVLRTLQQEGRKFGKRFDDGLNGREEKEADHQEDGWMV